MLPKRKREITTQQESSQPSKKQKLSPTLSNLPPEVIELIGEFIPPTDLSTFLSLSKAFSISRKTITKRIIYLLSSQYSLDEKKYWKLILDQQKTKYIEKYKTEPILPSSENVKLLCKLIRTIHLTFPLSTFSVKQHLRKNPKRIFAPDAEKMMEQKVVGCKLYEAENYAGLTGLTLSQLASLVPEWKEIIEGLRYGDLFDVGTYRGCGLYVVDMYVDNEDGDLFFNKTLGEMGYQIPPPLMRFREVYEKSYDHELGFGFSDLDEFGFDYFEEYTLSKAGEARFKKHVENVSEKCKKDILKNREA